MLKQILCSFFPLGCEGYIFGGSSGINSRDMAEELVLSLRWLVGCLVVLGLTAL